jgi:hypothetical protein
MGRRAVPWNRRPVIAVIGVSVVMTSLTACLESESESGAVEVGDETAGAGVADESQVMPDVVCLNLQDAQDEIQESGVFYSRSVDATGQDRRQIVDRNWIVVDQSPAPGADIDEGDAVLAVVKDDDPNECGSEVGEIAAGPVATTSPALPSTAPSTTSTTVPVPSTPAPTTTTTPPSTPPPVIVTTVPSPTTPLPATTPPPPPPPPTVAFVSPSCDPNYEGACVPIASDVDCAGGSGNGPAYVNGPVRVVGSDIYGLDGNDNDGIGCE